jgi:hypothetical protein
MRAFAYCFGLIIRADTVNTYNQVKFVVFARKATKTQTGTVSRVRPGDGEEKRASVSLKYE